MRNLTALILSAGLAGPSAVLAAPAAADPTNDGPPHAISLVDAATGATVHIWRAGSAMTLMVATPDLSLTKQVSPAGARVAVCTSGATVEMAISTAGIRVDSGSGAPVSSVSTGDLANGRTPAVSPGGRALFVQALAVLDRLDPLDNAPADWLVGNTARLLAALVGSSTGPSSRPVAFARVVPFDHEPGDRSIDCWDRYVDEAERIARDLMDCLDQTSWWNAPARQVCSLRYTVRAEVAFGEYLACDVAG